MKMPTLFHRGFALLLVSIFAVQAAPPASRGERILQQELRQQQIQRTTQRVADQLNAVINEFERNGITGEDVKVLRAIRMVLGRLSEREMAQVVTLLQTAQKSGDDLDAKKNVTEAYSGQKTIITQLKQLLLEYQRQQALYEMSIMLRALATRQSANMRIGVWLARTTEGRNLNSYGEQEKMYIRQQEIDQTGLKDETVLVLKRLEKLASETDGTATGERPKAALELSKTGGLVPALDAAVDDLKNNKLLSATGNERKARDQMRDVARALLMSKDLIDLLRAAIQETEAVILQQKAVTELTRKMERKDDARDAEDKQFEVVDNTDLIKRDINDVAPTASSYFRAAIDYMQQARAVLNDNRETKQKVQETPLKQTDALTNLELARRALQEQLAKAEKDAAKPENVLANLRELKKQVEELIKKEEKLKEDTAALEQKPKDLQTRAPEQGDIRDQTQDAQQKAASDAPEAAQALNDAATQMEKAQKDLAKSKNSPEAQQAAVESLKKASDELDKQIAKLEQAEKQLASLEELREKVEKVIADEQQIRADTAKEAAKSDKGDNADANNKSDQAKSDQAKSDNAQAKNDQAKSDQSPKNNDANAAQNDKKDALSDLAKKQDQTGKETGQLQNDAQQAAPEAAQHLGDAQKQMQQAKSDLDQKNAQAAQKPETKALNELYAAKKDIDSKINDLRNELGLPQDNAGQSLADAAAALEKAQQEVNQAQGEMAAKQAMQSAAKLLDQALKDVSPIAAGEAGPLPAAADAAVQEAQEALTQAAAQAAAEKSEPAQAQAANAAQALAQAQAALALAQAGLNSEMAQGQGPQGQGQQPGQGKGQQPGQGQGQGKQPGQGKGTPPPRGTGDQGNMDGSGGANGPRNGVAGSSSFVGLPKRDRAAIQQSQAEKYPQEYGPLVEQYLKNLSDQSGR
jgi:hypothetical protein